MTLPSTQLPTGVLMRLATPDDAAPLADALRENRSHLAPWEPAWPETHFTEEGQATRLGGLLMDHNTGRAAPWLLTDGARIVGGITLTGIARGPFCSSYLGYWVAASHEGKGLVSTGVAHAAKVARDHLGLHRIEATTLLTNTRSQAVLTRCGFDRIGTAPNYLHINGAWRDHAIFQQILHDETPPGL
ncbi:putative ribosomal N-acetyltransferase YdaF [Streptomyces sp. RB5]|uniref:Putative ribosomal N-acetyltransferase YdaF n=1 Tax=Streptomyces smaragdinus TaxID=2585196 RepID=A0A7K0CA72_9ACTN|nr:GNAT family N-acetyltransferase [Streptomyces smaragdinus]MQY10357.1 putative ribosomal N-acetyltransferase YdaF [Streptomyces smaragdinus]